MGCGANKEKGSSFCAIHKRVAANVHNQVAKETGKKGDEWNEYSH